MAKLILLDVNGVLCFKDATKSINASVKCKNYHVVMRPNVLDFLKKLSQQFTVGIFSSTTYVNLEKILNLVDLNWKRYIHIVADRGTTTLDPDFGHNDKISNYDTVKNLSQFWNHPIHNKDRKWNKGNTVLVDHDPMKVRFNDPLNIIMIDEFKSLDEKETLKDVHMRILSEMKR